jgi:hypothetical protein
VLYGETTIRILHPSFGAFLTDPVRCKYEMLFIDLNSQNLRVAAHCLDRLDRFLKYNICNLQPSVTADRTTLPEDIVYACRYWVEHICLIKDASPIANKLEAYLFKHLVHWLEAMCILTRSGETIEMLRRLRNWHRVRRRCFYSAFLTICLLGCSAEPFALAGFHWRRVSICSNFW